VLPVAWNCRSGEVPSEGRGAYQTAAAAGLAALRGAAYDGRCDASREAPAVARLRSRDRAMPDPDSAETTKRSTFQPNPLPVAAPSQHKDPRATGKGVPDLHIEEIEERHIPKDRNVFDK
jgi:hypothetical protein